MQWTGDGRRIYLTVAVVIVVAYAGIVGTMWARTEIVSDGPLRLDATAAVEAPPGAALDLDTYVTTCETFLDAARRPDDATKVVAGVVDDRALVACYRLSPRGDVWKAAVFDGGGLPVTDHVLLKRTGAWVHMGLVKTTGEVLAGGLAVAALLAMFGIYYARPRPGLPRERRTVYAVWDRITIILSIAFGLGLLLIAVTPGNSRARKVRLAIQGALAFATFWLVAAWGWYQDAPDPLGRTVLLFLATAWVVGWLGGVQWLKPRDAWNYPDDDPPPTVPNTDRPAGLASRLPNLPSLPRRQSDAEPSTATPLPVMQQQPSRARQLDVRSPSDLPTFADVGGMATLKADLEDTVGLLLAFAPEAERLRIDFNGILLHGPPGVGKTFIAQATAGEFGLNLLNVSVADLTSRFAGESVQAIQQAFETAAANIPCLLLFDEFDAIAERREDTLSEDSRRSVNQLLQSLERYRETRSLIVIASTNHVDKLDPAVIRPGRFDRRIAVGVPDRAARREILSACLKDRDVTDDIDLEDLARRTEGLTPASLEDLVDTAALAALRETAAAPAGQFVAVSHAHLRGALNARRGRDRPTVERAGFGRLVLDDRVAAELRQVQVMLRDPDVAASYGVKSPSGLLLAGPPGTGKTSVARALAAEANCSFYATTVADLTSKWVGEGEEQIQRLFARARDNRPAIVFIDEIDSIAQSRSSLSGYADRLVGQLLAEMDGLTTGGGVFVIGATNRPDQLDPAMLRAGRLSRTLWLGLPDRDARARLLELFSAEMPLEDDVDLGALAERTEGMSGADLEGLCQQAAIEAMIAASSRGSEDAAHTPEPSVGTVDFDTALAALQAASDDDRPTEASLRGALDDLIRRGG